MDQVLSGDQMVVHCLFPVKVTTVQHFRAQGETIMRPVRFLVQGIPTKERHAGEDPELLGVFEITGRKTYTSADGQNKTLLVLSEFDMAPSSLTSGRPRPRLAVDWG